MTKSPSPLSEEPLQSVWRTAQLLGGSSSHEKTAIEISALQRGHECLAQGKLQDAEECYRHALQLNPASIEGYQALAEVFNLQGRLEESATCYRRAIDLLSSSSVEAAHAIPQSDASLNSFPVVEVEQLQTLLEQAEAALAAKQWNIVKDRCEQLLQLQPSAKTYKLLGNALQAKGEIEAAVLSYTQALQLQPDWAEVYANLGSLKAQQQQWQAAIEQYQKAISLKPDFAGAYRNLARIWAQINQPDQARQCWYQAFTLEPQKATPEAHFDLGNQLLEQGDRSAAIACYRHAIDQDPNFAAAYHNLAIALSQPESSSAPAIERSELAATRSAQTVVGASQQVRPQSADQWVDLGTTYAEQQQWEKAKSCYQQALQLDPNQAAAHWNLSEVWQEMQNPIAAAESMYQALRLEPTWASPEEHLALGHRLLNSDRADLASACYLRVTQLAPNHADAFYGLGEVLARKGQLSDAVAHYRRAIERDSNQLAYYRSFGQALIQLKDWPQVQDCYRQLVRLEPQNPQNYGALAEAATQQGQIETALQTYRQLVEVQPTFWEAHHKIGDLLTQQQQWDAAIESFQRSIDLNPQFSWSHNNLGDALLHLERWQEAAEAFERAISLKSDFHWSHYNLGEACTQLKRWDKAVAAYRNALALNPDLPRLQQKLGFALRHQGEAILIEALSCYRRAIEQDPDDVQNYHCAIDLQPDDATLYHRLANVLTKQGNHTGAVVFRQIAEIFNRRMREPQSKNTILVSPNSLSVVQDTELGSHAQTLVTGGTGENIVPMGKECLDVRLHSPLAFVDWQLGGAEFTSPSMAYTLWLKRNAPKTADLIRMVKLSRTLNYKPLISIIVPVYNTPKIYLVEMLETVLAQTYPYWELCIADDASPYAYVKELLEEYASKDARIKLVFRQSNGHISAASSSALQLATGEFIALLDHDDLLAPNALYEIASLLNIHPEADMIYSDEDKINEDSELLDPHFKPDWCPDLFLSQNYVCHLGVYRRTLLNQIGGFRVGYEGSQDYDLILRLIEKTNNIFHIPKVLYHWRIHPASAASGGAAKPYAYEAGKRALQDALKRRGEPGKIVPHTVIPGVYTVRYDLTDYKLVSIIIPSRNLASLLDRCLYSIFERTTYPNYEVIVIDNGSDQQEAFTIFEMWRRREPQRFRLIHLDIPFNYSRLNNYGVSQAKGDYLLFLNNDTEVVTPDWIEALVEQAQRSCIGAVGALLLYPDDTIQHAGVVLGVHGVAGHGHRNFHRSCPGYFARLFCVSNYSAVTAACLMCRREIYNQVDGFDETLKVAFNDVDFCLKLKQQGYNNVYLPHVVLYHHESKSRGAEDTLEKQQRFHKEIQIMQDRWIDLLNSDPCYSPNLTLHKEDYDIRIEVKIEILEVELVQFPNQDICAASIDLPIEGETQFGVLKIAGWVVGRRSKALIIEVLSDHDHLTTHHISVDNIRPDIECMFPDISYARESGFMASLDITRFPMEGNLLLQVVLEDDWRTHLGRIKIKY